jgi:hypothetical protein
VSAHCEELSKVVATQYAQNHHDRVELMGNHPVEPNCHSAKPRTYLAQIGNTEIHQEREVVDVVSAKEEQK